MPALAENKHTEKIITRERLDLIKPTAMLVGINRVRVLWDEEYVFKKVAKKEIGGYALEGEGLKDPVKYKGNIWPAPDMAGYTKDAFRNLIKIWVDNMIGAAKGKNTDRVN